jgi:hypothetical protein
MERCLACEADRSGTWWTRLLNYLTVSPKVMCSNDLAARSQIDAYRAAVPRLGLVLCSATSSTRGSANFRS